MPRAKMLAGQASQLQGKQPDSQEEQESLKDLATTPQFLPVAVGKLECGPIPRLTFKKSLKSLTQVFPIFKCWQLVKKFFSKHSASQTTHVCRLGGYVHCLGLHRLALLSVEHMGSTRCRVRSHSAPECCHCRHALALQATLLAGASLCVSGCGRKQAVPRPCHPIFPFRTFIKTVLVVMLSVLGIVCHS